MKKTFVYQLKENLKIEFDLNDWAQRADISLITRFKDTLILTTVVLGDKKENLDFTPLTVEYDEKFYSVGKIYGSKFIRREGKPSETAIINARLIDRSLRPTLKYFPYEIQVNNSILSLDKEFDPDVLSVLNSSLALGLLNIPLSPVGAVKIAKVENELVLFPTNEEILKADFTLTLAGIKNRINMIELEGKEAKERDVLSALRLGIKEIEKITNFFENIIKENGFKIEKDIPNVNYLDYGYAFLEKYKIDLEKEIFSGKERVELSNIFNILEENKEHLENFDYTYKGILEACKKVLKDKILKEKIRPDGRKLDEIRKIEIEVNVLPRPHGSVLFKRGLTHVLSAVTLAPLSEELWIRGIEMEGFKRFIHHYNFPPFCIGEIGPLKAPSRREIGHGNLVEKALKNLIPSEEVFPYTIRIVSDVLSSNGSTSMASVCSTSLALFDSGTPIKKHCAGISIGLIYEDENNYELLTDIQGVEDFWGDMDFKIAGTKEGITAIQLDVKNEGLTLEIIKQAFQRAKDARHYLIELMEKIIPQPRAKFKEGVPYTKLLQIDPSKIGLLIGPGGKNIHEIIALTNSKIDIRPDGSIYISADNEEVLNKTEHLIKISTNTYQVGDIIEGEVIKILPFGAILNIGLERTALLHISEIANRKILNIEDELKIGDKLKVRIKNINEDGKIYVSLKDV